MVFWISQASTMRHQIIRHTENLTSEIQFAFVKGILVMLMFVPQNWCHKKKERIAMTKLDFEKVFDKINWTNLLNILKLGFSPRWLCACVTVVDWTRNSYSTIGCPGPCFTCGWGVHQGNPISPLFIIFTNLLNLKFVEARKAGVIHGISGLNADMESPLVLQFADITFLIVKVNAKEIINAEMILASFSLFGGSWSIILRSHNSPFWDDKEEMGSF